MGKDYVNKCPICHNDLFYLVYSAASEKAIFKGIFNMWEEHTGPTSITDVDQDHDDMNAGDIRYFCPHCDTLLFKNEHDAWNYMVHGILTESSRSELTSKKLSD